MNAAITPARAAAMLLAFPRFRSAASPGPASSTSISRRSLPKDAQRGFFEVHAENYMGAGGPPHRALEADPPRPSGVAAWRLHVDRRSSSRSTRRIWRVSAHLVERYEPALVSEHLAWSTHETTYFNDLLPLPYTEATLSRVCDHIDEVQEAIRRPMLLENPSTYVAFRESTMSETDFIRASPSAPDAACCSTSTMSSSPPPITASPRCEYLADFPLARVGEIHLAGHAEQADDEGDPLLIDSHDGPVADAVWKLYEIVIGRCGPDPDADRVGQQDSGLAGPEGGGRAPRRRSSTVARRIAEDRHAAA